MTTKKTILIIVLGILIFIVLFSFMVFISQIKPPKLSTNIYPEDFNLKYEKISFKTKDNLVLRGWFIPSNYSNATIVVGHGYPFDKNNILPATKFLNKHYNLLYYDFRYFGESDGKITTLAYKEQQDMLDAIEYLKTRKDVDKDKIGVFGFSLSAGTALLINSKDVKVIVADSSYASINKLAEELYFKSKIITFPFKLMFSIYSKIFLGKNLLSISPEKAVEKLEIPILLIHGDADSQFPLEHSQILHKNAPNSELWIIKGAEHGYTFSTAPKEYEKRVLEFFDKHLLEEK